MSGAHIIKKVVPSAKGFTVGGATAEQKGSTVEPVRTERAQKVLPVATKGVVFTTLEPFKKVLPPIECSDGRTFSKYGRR